jgi:hypothetical protein
MISYLEVNPENPRDNKSLTVVFNNLPATYREQIYSIDSIYKKTSYSCILIFIINTILSGMIVYKYNYGDQTTSTFITNVLFMTTKIYYTYYVTNTDKSIFYSAYIHDRVQYNDIDPKIKTDIESGFIFSNRQLTCPQPYAKLRDTVELLTHEIKEEILDETKEQDVEQEEVMKGLYVGSYDSDEELDFSLGFPLELPRQQNRIELEFEFPLGETFIDLPNEVGPEDPNKEVIDLIRESVKEVLAEMRRKMENDEEKKNILDKNTTEE